MLHVLLINAPILLDKIKYSVGDEKWCPPLGLMYIASFLEKNGFRVKLLDVRAMDMDMRDIITFIDQEHPKVIGISALTSSIRAALDIAKAIKEKYNNKIHICLGGSHVSADPNIIDRFPFFDSAITQEGEFTFKEIVERIVNGERITGIFKGEACMNLDILPFPSRSLIKKDNYRENRAFILSSRGCPYKCIFCSLPAIPDKVRYRSAENVVEEIATLSKLWQGRFLFIDDTFTLNRTHVVDICQQVINRNIKISWVANTRADLVDDELLRLMSQAGCEEIALGVESGSERVRMEIIGKKIKDKQISKAVTLCRKNRIKASFFLMLGFPTETTEDIEKTVQCGQRFKPDIIGVHLTVPMPGSRLFVRAIEESQLKPDIIDQYVTGRLGQGFRGVWPIYVPQGLSKDYIYKMRRKAYYKFYLRPSFLIRRFFFSVRSWKQLCADIRTLINLLRYGRTDSSIT